MRGKPETNHDNKVPGPGNYDPNINVVKDRPATYKIVGSKREDFLSQS